jgi:hypothetical protein
LRVVMMSRYYGVRGKSTCGIALGCIILEGRVWDRIGRATALS